MALPIALAIIPALLIMWYFHKMDLARPEPRSMIWKVFFLGVVVTAPTALLSSGLDAINNAIRISPLAGHFIRAFVIAGLVEESMKLWVVRRRAYPAFDEMTDGIMYAVVASMGFACLENILYTMNGGISVALIRAFTAVPMHAIASGIMGYFIGKARFDEDKQSAHILTGLALAVLIHGLYDFVLFAIPEWGLAPALLVNIPLLIIGAVVLVRLFKKARRDDEMSGRLLNMPLDTVKKEGIILNLEE